jgi:NAD+ diphosphatase
VRNAYCSACGKRTQLLEAGHKRSCPKEEGNATQCISHNGVQNFAYPRTGKFVNPKPRSSKLTNFF